MDERQGYQNNEAYGGQNPGEIKDGQEGMYGQDLQAGKQFPQRE